jgi:hypothetical protein
MKSSQFIGTIMLWLSVSVIFFNGIALAAGATNDPLRSELGGLNPITDNNLGLKLNWIVDRSVGLFSIQRYHLRDGIQIEITEANKGGLYYKATLQRFYWREQVWQIQYTNGSPQFYVIPVDWKNSFYNFVIENSSLYWARHPLMIQRWATLFNYNPYPEKNTTTGQDILNFFMIQQENYLIANPGQSYDFWTQNYTAGLIINYTKVVLSNYAQEIFTTSQYTTEWFQNRFIDMVHLNIYFDDNNYERFIYTREEGILISRETEINIANGTALNDPLTGSFKLTLQEFNKEFKVSPYHYIIWVSVVFVSIMVTVITVSLLVSRHQRKMQMLDY